MAQKILQQSIEAESALADALTFDDLDDFQRTGNKKTYRPFEDHSDDSETSSVCSERSFDSFRRPSDISNLYSWNGSQPRLLRDLWEPVHKDIGEIISNCASTHWSDRKEGLVSLQSYLQAGHNLSPSELKRITDTFTKMFMDSHTKVFSLFLDTLNDLVLTHHMHMHDWVYILLTRLLNKLGGDLLGSITNKIHRTLDVVRQSFPLGLLLNDCLRFIADQTQTPNARVKVSTLSFIQQLAEMGSPEHFPPTARAAIAKIIGWSTDLKSAEIRRGAQNVLVALFNLNTPEFTMLLAKLPKEYQETASMHLHQHLRRVSSGSEGSTPPSPLPPLSPRGSIQSPGTPRESRSGQSSRSNTIDMEDEHLNPEEVYRSLRRTTAEIQNYSFEGGGRERDTTSQDSGISQMSAGPGDRLDTLEERLEDHGGSLNNSVSGSGRSSSLSSPTHRHGHFNGLDVTDNGVISHGNFGDNSEIIQRAVEQLGTLPPAERKIELTQLLRVVRESSTAMISDSFKTLLRVLLENLICEDGGVRALVLGVLTEMLKKRALASGFQSYVELMILRILQAHKDNEKDVVRAAEACAGTVAAVLPSELVVRVLNPIVRTGDFPVNQAAIKMLTRLIEQRGAEAVESNLEEIMPGLVKAYDNAESSVRKSAVFCMVALHSAVGEAVLKPHLQQLNGSKLKLLHLYIRRAQQGSAPGSPQHQPSTPQ